MTEIARFELRLKRLADQWPEEGRFWSDNNGLERLIDWLSQGLHSKDCGPMEIQCQRYAKPSAFEQYKESPPRLVVVMPWDEIRNALTAEPCVWRGEEYEGIFYSTAGFVLPPLPETATEFEKFSRNGRFFTDAEKEFLEQGWTTYLNRIRRLCEEAWKRAENLPKWIERGALASGMRTPEEPPKKSIFKGAA